MVNVTEKQESDATGLPNLYEMFSRKQRETEEGLE